MTNECKKCGYEYSESTCEKCVETERFNHFFSDPEWALVRSLEQSAVAWFECGGSIVGWVRYRSKQVHHDPLQAWLVVRGIDIQLPMPF